MFGFAGFGRNPDYFQGDDDNNPAPNAAGSSKTGVAQCFTVGGLTLREAELAGVDTTLFLDGVLGGTPCINVGRFEDGTVKPKQSKGNGFTYRFNGTYKPNDDLMFYATWSKGFRPGGINRQPGLAAYKPDFLINYELGWKTNFGPFRWNGAVYHQKWQKFQFSFLGENSLTVVQNGRDAKINGIESDVNYTAGGLTLNAAASYTDAKTADPVCNVAADTTPDCDLLLTPDNPLTVADETEFDFPVAPKGARLPITPKFKMSTTARYAWDVGSGRAHVQGSLVYQGSARSDLKSDDNGEGNNPNDLTGKLRAYTLVDLFAGYSWGNYSAELFGTNLFDKRNDLSRFVVCGNCTNVHIVPGRPRTIGIRAGVKF